MKQSRASSSIYSFLIMLLSLQFTLSPASAGEKFEAAVRKDLNEMFATRTGFLGGDGFYTVALDGERTLVVFGDTIAGKIENGRRNASKMANNSIAIVTRKVIETLNRTPECSMSPATRKRVTYGAEFFLGDGLFPFFKPIDKDRFFWPLGGTMAGGKLYLFAALIERTAANDAFGFKEAGNFVYRVDNPADPPSKWKLSRSTVAAAKIEKGKYIIWGSSVLFHEGYIYIYGVKSSGASKCLVLARALPQNIEDSSAWEYYDARAGFSKEHEASLLLPGVANEFSVTYDGDARKFRLVYTLDSMNSRIVMRSSDTPVFGPKNGRVTVYNCPEHGMTKNVFTYSAKAVGPLCGKGRTVVVYFSNSSDFWEPFSNLEIYRPRFVEIKTKTPDDERF